jgi:hypothetical protein
MRLNLIFFVKKNKIILGLLILIVYYEIKLYNISICQNKTLIVEHLNFFGNDEFLLELNNKINSFLRFGDEYQNFILSLISRRTQFKNIILEEREIDILEELNK